MWHTARTHQHSAHSDPSAPETSGHVIHWARRYDLLLGMLTLGRERAFRQRLLDLAQLQRGDVVLDVGCGTGTLALAAKRRVGAGGRVIGIDPSPSMIARARQKAARRGLAVDFQTGVIEAIALPDRTVDVVLSSFVLHHLPEELVRSGLVEITRVLKPGGRVLMVDFWGPSGPWQRRLSGLQHLMEQQGFQQVETGVVRHAVVSDLGFVRGQLS